MATNYAIVDGEGNQLTAGLQDHNVWRAASRMATERGESVWVYEERTDEAEQIEVRPYHSELSQYRGLTAADMGVDAEAAVRAMRDEPGEVAREIGCTTEQVLAWCAAQV